MKLRCIIVDDEVIARKSLERLCLKVESLQLVNIFENPREALSYLEESDVDLIFLDVEMPDLSGIEFMDHIGDLSQIILTTSKTEYAYEAFQYHVSDYLKKPISLPRFEQAIQKAIEIHRQDENYEANTNDIYIREDGRYVRIRYEDILYFENAGDYIYIKTEQGNHIIHGTIKSIDARIKDSRFQKVHRSYIVNLNKIIDIEDTTLVIGKKVIPISRSHKSLLVGNLNLL
ncbi:MAG: response regulator transcription factor [Saprospiraceae bacterium]|nr:response regulator transcription factor [Saprospiraceae bacterium]